MDWKEKPAEFLIFIGGVVLLSFGILGILYLLLIPSPFIFVASTFLWLSLGIGILMGMRFFTKENPYCRKFFLICGLIGLIWGILAAILGNFPE